MRVLTLPNLITFVRIILVPVFVIALSYKRYDVALIFFVCAGLSDALDGLLARRTNQKTALGAFLDPLADKALMVTSFILFSVYGWIPTWLTITVISRDLIIVLGYLILYLVDGTTTVIPTFTGKSANALQVILIAYTLLSINVTTIPSPALWMFIVITFFTVASGMQYVYRALGDSDGR